MSIQISYNPRESIRRRAEPLFQDARDVTQVAVVGSVSLGPKSFLGCLKLFLHFKNAGLYEDQGEFHAFRNPQSYITSPAMAFYIQPITEPYTDSLRTTFKVQKLKIYLIMDNHSVHNCR
jgi:hypothetical protein